MLTYSLFDNKQQKNKYTRKQKLYSSEDNLKAKLHNTENIHFQNEDDLSDDENSVIPSSNKITTPNLTNTYNNSLKDTTNIEPMQSMNDNEEDWSQNFNRSNIFKKKEEDNVQINKLVEKMNNIILLLEENYDEKKGSVTEEIILYCFLGIFIIYLVDSFVKVGKYVR